MASAAKDITDVHDHGNLKLFRLITVDRTSSLQRGLH